MISRRVFNPLLILACAAGLPEASAQTSISGFFSQSLVYSPDNPYYADELDFSADFRELGVNASWQANGKIRFAGQVISRRLGDIDDGTPKLDFGLIDYTAISRDWGNLGIRLGRTKNAYGIYNKTRDVPHARPSTTVPRSIYFESMRDALLSTDGGNVYLNLVTGIGDFGFEAYAGETDLEGNVTEYLMFQTDTTGSFGDVDIVGARLEFTPLSLPELTLAYSFIDVEMALEHVDDFTPAQMGQAFAEIMADRTVAGRYATSINIEPVLQLASLQYALEQWVFTAEYLQVDIDVSDLAILFVPSPDYSNTLESYYLQAEWQAKSQWSLFARYEDLVYDKDDRKGQQYALETGLNAVTYYSNGFTVGSRWYITPDASLTAEYSVYEGASTLVGPNSIDYSELVEDWELFVVQFSYHF